MTSRHTKLASPVRRLGSLTAAWAGPIAGLAAAAFLLAPAETRAYDVFGDTLDLTQRDFRIQAVFTGVNANTNQTPDPDFPGSLGGELAIRKGVAEWGSRPHGSGLTDPYQDLLGSGGSNFDAFYAGRATEFGGPNRNIISVIPGGGGSFAFTDIPIGDGWRIRFRNLAKDWNDSPFGPVGSPNRFDIQGVATHEFGHALGLDHSLDPDATMNMSASPAEFAMSLRSIEADDIAGLQFLYGALHPTKPVVERYELLGAGRVRVIGTGFDPVSNDLWFTRAAATGGMFLDTLVIEAGLPSLVGGTLIEATIPADAGLGSIAVRVPGDRFNSLSNVYPFDFQRDPWQPPTLYGTPGMTSTGDDVRVTWTGIPSASVSSLRLGVEGAGAAPYALLIEGTTQASRVTSYGTLGVGGMLRRVSVFSLVGGAGETPIPVLPTGTVADTRYYQVWIPDAGSTGGGVFSDALEIEITL